MPNRISTNGYTILDARCIMSLYASGQMSAILATLPEEFALVDYVYSNETLRIYSQANADTRGPIEPIDLTSCVTNKLLHIVFPDAREEDIAIQLSSIGYLDSGEALTAALAIQRHWAMGTDDQHITAFLKKHFPYVQVFSLLKILRGWAEHTYQPSAAIETVLQNIKKYTAYGPMQSLRER